MPQLLDTTIRAFQNGLTNLAQDKAIQQGVKNIESWMTRLEKEEFRGAKIIHENLGKLKRHLEADELDRPAIGELLKALGEETIRAASHAESKEAQKVKQLGEALVNAAKG